MPVPSASYSITMRVHLDGDPRGIGRITTAVGEAGAAVAAVDVVESHPNLLVVDLTCNTGDSGHADEVTKMVNAIDGAHVHKVSDRTFLLHLGGKLEVTSRVPLRTRDDLSMAYTPGVARVCLAIGSWTLVMTCQGVEPLEMAASTTVGEIAAMPSAVILMATGAA